MPDEREIDVQSIWRNQQLEELPMNLELFVNRRAQELRSVSRAETVMSIAAPVFLVVVLAWRFASTQQRLPDLGLVAVIAWVMISLYRFRDRLWRGRPAREDALALTGIEHYRKELEGRRDHLRNEWLWDGPLLLGCAILVMVMTARTFLGFERLRSAAPLIALLALWAGFGLRRRWRQASEIQREIDEIGMQ